MLEENKEIIEADMSAKEFFENLFNMDWMDEDERELIYKTAELYATGKVRVAEAKVSI